MANTIDLVGLFANFYDTQIKILNEQSKFMKELAIAMSASSTSSTSNSVTEKVDTIAVEKKRKKTHEHVDPNKPKKFKTSYIFFCEENMPLAKAKYPEVPARDLMGMVAKEWRTIDAETKKEYENRALEDKKGYLNRMESYNQNIKDTTELEADGNMVDDEDSEEHDEDEEETQLLNSQNEISTIVSTTSTTINAVKFKKPLSAPPALAINQPPKVLPSTSVSKNVSAASSISLTSKTPVLAEVMSPLKPSSSSSSSGGGGIPRVPSVATSAPKKPVEASRPVTIPVPVPVPTSAAAVATISAPPKQMVTPQVTFPPAAAAVAVEESRPGEDDGLSEKKKRKKDKKKRLSIADTNGIDNSENSEKEPTATNNTSALPVMPESSELATTTTTATTEATDEKKSKKKNKKNKSDDISPP